MNRRIIGMVLLAIGYGIGFFLIRQWTSSYPEQILRQQLSFIWPYFLEGVVLGTVLTAVLNWRSIRDTFSQIDRKAYRWLGVLMIVAFLLSGFLAPRQHRIFYDEDIYLNVAQTIASDRKAAYCLDGENRYGRYRCNELEYNKQPSGYPYLVSVLYRLTGTTEWGAHLLQNGFFAVSVGVLFLLGWLLFGDILAALSAGAVFMILPHNLKWFNTTSAEPAAALFAGASLLCTLLFARQGRPGLGILTVFMIAFSSNLRPESPLIIPVCLAAILLYRPGLFKTPMIYGLGLLLLFLFLPHFAHRASVQSEKWGADTTMFSIPTFDLNFPTNLFYYLNNDQFPLLVTVLALSGFVMLKRTSSPSAGINQPLDPSVFKPKSVLSLWFLLFWGIFLFFYAGSYRFGADVRYALVSFMPIALFAGLGVRMWFNEISRFLGPRNGAIVLGILFAICWLSFLPNIRAADEEAWGSRLDHDAVGMHSQVLHPHDVVITFSPHMFLLQGKNAIYMDRVINPVRMKELRNRYDRYFLYYDFWCHVQEANKRVCNQLLDTYPHTTVESVEARNYRYTLYELDTSALK